MEEAGVVRPWPAGVVAVAGVVRLTMLVQEVESAAVGVAGVVHSTMLVQEVELAVLEGLRSEDQMTEVELLRPTVSLPRAP